MDLQKLLDEIESLKRYKGIKIYGEYILGKRLLKIHYSDIKLKGIKETVEAVDEYVIKSSYGKWFKFWQQIKEALKR